MNDKSVFRIIFGISIFVFITVIVLNKKVLPRPDSIPHFVYSLPTLNALLNATCSVLLLTSLYFIKQKKVAIHRKLSITTFILSSVFLLSYITYHYLAEERINVVMFNLRCMATFFCLMKYNDAINSTEQVALSKALRVGNE